jgi:hypothetical protein
LDLRAGLNAVKKRIYHFICRESKPDPLVVQPNVLRHTEKTEVYINDEYEEKVKEIEKGHGKGS